MNNLPRSAYGMTFGPSSNKPGIESRLPDNRIGIKAEIAQDWHDLLGKGEVDAAGGKRRVSARRWGTGPIACLPRIDVLSSARRSLLP